MNLYKPLPNVEVFKNALMYRGPSVWNELPLQLKTCTKGQSFKNMYKRLFFYSQFFIVSHIIDMLFLCIY